MSRATKRSGLLGPRPFSLLMTSRRLDTKRFPPLSFNEFWSSVDPCAGKWQIPMILYIADFWGSKGVEHRGGLALS